MLSEVIRWSLATNAVRTVLQVAVYMGKRDFVDHCDFVDPVGENIYTYNFEISWCEMCRL